MDDSGKFLIYSGVGRSVVITNGSVEDAKDAASALAVAHPDRVFTVYRKVEAVKSPVSS
jgi:hypothetical protein